MLIVTFVDAFPTLLVVSMWVQGVPVDWSTLGFQVLLKSCNLLCIGLTELSRGVIALNQTCGVRDCWEWSVLRILQAGKCVQ